MTEIISFTFKNVEEKAEEEIAITVSRKVKENVEEMDVLKRKLLEDANDIGQAASVPVYITVENARKYKEKLAAQSIKFPKLIHLRSVVVSSNSKSNE